MTSKISRRGVFGIGAGASVAFMDGTAAVAQSEAKAASFSLLLVNDIYKMSDNKGRGGFARLATIVQSERAKRVPMLFCHAGDCFSPSLMSGFDQGAHIVALTNMVKPDVFVPGNHEFDFGKEAFFTRMREANFPFFAANMRSVLGLPLPGIRDAEIYDLGTVKVGVLGLVMEEVPQVSHPGDIVFLSVMETLRAQAKVLRDNGADILVAVAHTGREVDNLIVRSRLVDILLTGHDHDLAIAYDGKTVMVESNEEGNFVTSVDVAVTITGEGSERVVSWSPSFRVHDSSKVEPDPKVRAAVAVYEGELAGELNVALGSTRVALDSRTGVLRTQETAIGNFVADAMRDSTAADVTVLNSGSIRANETYPPGAVLTRRDVLSELPFGNTTALVEVSGATLREVLEHGFSQIEEMAGRFPQVSGMSVRYRPRAPAGNRVVSVDVGGVPLDPAARYRLAVNNFMLGGGDGYTMLSRGRVLIGATDGKLVANEVMVHLRKLGTIAPEIEGRIVAVN
jgi:5'-nucleotidase/UDP-sugar diphosphatase